ncbi:MAG: PPC domain-containing protein, partial [Chthoniobacterales bacterium]|nr:PPC domain-containing protein [Chthoniobacterales bacterium]
MMLAMFSFAATPSTGTLSESTPVLQYDAGPFTVANATPILFVDSGPECGPGQPCDSYKLNVSVSSQYLIANPNALVKVTLYWSDTGAGVSDYDLYVFKGDVGDLDGGTQAPYQSASGANPEVASITPIQAGTYTIKIVPYTPSAETVHVRVELLAGSGGAGGFPGFGGADATAPGKPRYQVFEAPAGTSAEPGSGEFNIGFNPASGRIMTMNAGPIWRLTPAEKFGKPECCEALWEDKSSLTTDTGVDPILWTDQK